MSVDLELGGTDQSFNMLAGRQLVSAMQGREKFVMTVPLLADAKGVKIGKTEGNAIGLTDAPNDFYGKIMSLGDDAIIPCFTLLTDLPDNDITAMQEQMTSGENPMKFKKQLAFALTKQFNSEEDAANAQKQFETRFQKGDLDNAELVSLSLQAFSPNPTLSEMVLASGFAASKSEAKRLIEQKAVMFNNELLTDYHHVVSPKKGDILKVGRKAGKITS